MGGPGTQRTKVEAATLAGVLLFGVVGAIVGLQASNETQPPATALFLTASWMVAGLVLSASARRDRAIPLLTCLAAATWAGADVSGAAFAVDPSPPLIALNLVAAIGVGCVIELAIRVPGLPPHKRVSSVWSFVGAAFEASRTLFLLGMVELPGVSRLSAALLADAGYGLIGIVVITVGYRRSSGPARERVRWVVLASTTALIPSITLTAATTLWPDIADLRVVVSLSYGTAILLPIGFLVAIVADDALSVDGRTKSALVLMGALLVTVVAAYLLTGSLLAVAGVGIGVRQSVSLVVVAAALLGVYQQLRLPLSRWFAPEEVYLPRASVLLAQRLPACGSPTDVAVALAKVLGHALRPEFVSSLVLGHADGEWVTVVTFGERPSEPATLSPDLDGIDFDRLGPVVVAETATLVGVHLDGALTIVVEFGERRSRLRSTPEDRRLIEGLALQAEGRLQQLDRDATIVRQRELVGILRASSKHDGASDAFRRLSAELEKPAQAIKLLGELLETQLDDDETRELAGSLRHALSSLVEMIADPMGHEAPEAVPLTTLAQRLDALFAQRAQAKGIRLEIELDSVRVSSHPSLLERMVGNLVSNAIRYTDVGFVRVTSATGSDPRQIVLSVSDTGPGIPAADHERIFQPYTQLDDDAIEGRGLGLAIVVVLAKKLGNQVALQSSPGDGTTVSLTLQVAGEDS